jgi:hypothetical protein
VIGHASRAGWPAAVRSPIEQPGQHCWIGLQAAARHELGQLRAIRWLRAASVPLCDMPSAKLAPPSATGFAVCRRAFSVELRGHEAM